MLHLILQNVEKLAEMMIHFVREAVIGVVDEFVVMGNIMGTNLSLFNY